MTTAAERVRASLDRADEVRAGRDGLNILLYQDADGARRRAKELDRADLASAGALQGTPIVLKDNIATTDLPTSCGSRILDRYVSPFDATVTRRVLDHDMVILGKTNLDEFAMGSSTENSAYGPTRNPWDTDRIPGGSGGGSAAAVAAFEAPLAIGTDTGGSIRQPAGRAISSTSDTGSYPRPQSITSAP